jgi:hypothetical protein
MTVLALATVLLAAGPVLVALDQRHGSAGTAIAGFTLGAVPTLVFTRHLPELYDEVGLAIPLLMLGGYRPSRG